MELSEELIAKAKGTKTPEELAAQEVEDLLASLTLEEKVGQLFFVRVPDTDAVSDVSTYHLGGYILFGRDTADKTADALIQTIQSYQDGVSYEDLYQRLLFGVDCPADQYLLLADFASYCAASQRVTDTYRDRERWNSMSLHNIARSGIFSADRSVADYADTIWHVPYKK